MKKIETVGLPDLIKSIRMQLHPDHLPRLKAIDDADYSGVLRKTHEHFQETGKAVTEEYLKRGVYALKQYYAIALLDPANAHAVSAAVDPFWHAHILHTSDYMDFCNLTVGEYMHHQPLDRTDKQKLENVRTLYQYTLDVLGQLFINVDSEFWSTDVSDALMICFHKGNQRMYPAVQPIRLFEPSHRGEAKAFAA